VTTDAESRITAMVSRTYDVSALVPPGGDVVAVRQTLAGIVRQSIHAPGSGAWDASCDLVADRLAVVADREQQLRVARLLSDCTSPDLQTRTRLAGRTIARWMIDDQPIRDTLDRLARESGIAIEPDWPALQEMGVEPESTVTVRARNLSAAKLLGVILENVVWRRGREGPAWYVRSDGLIVITSPTQADRRSTCVRMYDLYPYVARARLPGRERQIVEAVVSLIHDTVATNTWESGTGEAWIRCDRTRLYVRQTAEHHRQIASLLEQLLETSHLHFRGSEEVPANSDLIPPRTTAR